MLPKYRKRDLAIGLAHAGSGQSLSGTPSIAAAEAIISNFCEQLALALCSGKVVYLPGVGKFTPILRKGRYAKHPRTSDRIVFQPKMAVKFTSSTLLRKRLQVSLLEKFISEANNSEDSELEFAEDE
ncbi:bacterial nucleoid DNA-binding protein [Leptolyngbyaceae cyanobacterium JSC-12]|nr:bacterial nucleoid DNA-binding protein [Leptolyngbyaceae cyanobacterium JSC-12]